MDILDIGENIDMKTYIYPINWLDSICISYGRKEFFFVVPQKSRTPKLAQLVAPQVVIQMDGMDG